MEQIICIVWASSAPNAKWLDKARLPSHRLSSTGHTYTYLHKQYEGIRAGQEEDRFLHVLMFNSMQLTLHPKNIDQKDLIISKLSTYQEDLDKYIFEMLTRISLKVNVQCLTYVQMDSCERHIIELDAEQIGVKKLQVLRDEELSHAEKVGMYECLYLSQLSVQRLNCVVTHRMLLKHFSQQTHHIAQHSQTASQVNQSVSQSCARNQNALNTGHNKQLLIKAIALVYCAFVLVTTQQFHFIGQYICDFENFMQCIALLVYSDSVFDKSSCMLCIPTQT
uniref:Uncharacterized protein n=1 Tax=Glossina palpalis gambiensis TaxID=67801 RepID=A0A1B0AVP0_9MUSC